MKNAPLKKYLKAAVIAGGVCALIPTVYAQGIGSQTFERMLVPTPQKIERGAQVFAEQCATCHGDEGRGNAPLGMRLDPPAEGFISAGSMDSERGLVSIFNVVSKGLENVDHPVFNNLYFQDQWAVSHYVDNIAVDARQDSKLVMDNARFEAVNGVCDDNVLASISDVVQPTGDDQLAQGREVYVTQCASCHGDAGQGDGPAAAALVPPPRNFTGNASEWTNSTSPLAIFNSITLGIEGTSMPSYSHLSEDERWALTHFIRSEFVPANQLEDATDTQLQEVCRSLSAAPRPPAIDLDSAIRFIAEDASERRAIRLAQYGDVTLTTEANGSRGEALYLQNCVSCHGVQGKGMRNYGPHGKFPPFMYLNISPLVPASAGGNYQDFAQRTIAGPHATLPDMTFPALLSDQDWQDLQAYVASFSGEGKVSIQAPTPVIDETLVDDEQQDDVEAQDDAEVEENDQTNSLDADVATE